MVPEHLNIAIALTDQCGWGQRLRSHPAGAADHLDLHPAVQRAPGIATAGTSQVFARSKIGRCDARVRCRGNLRELVLDGVCPDSLIPNSRLCRVRAACDRRIAALRACVVLALPSRTCPMVLPFFSEKGRRYQIMGSNTWSESARCAVPGVLRQTASADAMVL